MTPKTSRAHNKELEMAIKFLVFRIHESGHNPKPVILHSIRLAIHLDDLGFRKEIVIAALLHDLVEDSYTSVEAIRSEFGGRVAELVEALTVDLSLPPKEGFHSNLKHLMHVGKDALVVKAADILDNSSYYHRADSEELKNWLYEKRKLFVDASESIIGDEPIWQELKNLCSDT